MADTGERRRKLSRLGVLITAMLFLLAAAMLWRLDKQLSADSGVQGGPHHWRTDPGQHRQISRSHSVTSAPLAEEDPIGSLAQELASRLARREPLPTCDSATCATILVEGTNSFTLKRQAARVLAADESDAGFALVLNVLTNSGSSSRAAMAEALGRSKRPETAALLGALLTDPDESVARGAVRGVAAKPAAEGLKELEAILAGTGLTLSVRTEAALCLGGLEDPAASEVLKAVALDVKNTTVAKHVLLGLGNRPFADTEQFYEDYLSNGQVPKELRVSALESLAGNDAIAAGFLLRFASQEADPEVRAAAAWAMSHTGDQGSFGVELVGLVKAETNPEVRRRLFQALRNQENCDATEVLQLLRVEEEQNVRLAAFDTLASALHSSGTPDTAAFFNQVATPELLRAALSAGSDSSAMEAVMTLRKARSPATVTALQQIAAGAASAKVAEAARSAVQAATKMRGR